MKTRKQKIVIRVVGENQCQHAIGIHCIGDVDSYDAQRHLESCDRDGFRVIYIHYPNVVNMLEWTKERKVA